MEERLQKILSRYGVASRRQAEAMIEAGRVQVNGRMARLGETADPDRDQISLDGAALTAPPENVYLMLHKPRGYVTTLRDEKGRRNVSELVADCGVRVYPVGRLDMDSEGLLLMTNDGALANRLMHPSGGVRKRYLVSVTGYYPGAERQLQAPIQIDGRLTTPAEVRLLWQRGNKTGLEFLLHDGRNRQIRRLCEAAGLTVTRLCRVQEGPLMLGDLPSGKWRPLRRDELERLEQALGWSFLHG